MGQSYFPIINAILIRLVHINVHAFINMICKINLVYSNEYASFIRFASINMHILCVFT